MTFTSEADASIYSASPTTNYGSSSKLETDNSPVKNFLIRFTVTGIGTGTVTNARLRLTCVDPSPRGGDITVAASNNWSESTVTWGTAPAAGATIASLGAVASGSTYEVDVSSLIHGDGTYTLRITTPNADGADYASREGTLASRPLLTVTLGPPPPPVNDVQPTFPIEAAFYYPWFPESWTQSGVFPFTDYHPSLGFYDTSTVAATHVQQMTSAHIEAGIASWWGSGSTTDSRIPTLLNAASGTPFRWSLYYELESTSDPPVAQLDAALDYIAAAYGSNPSYLRVNGKPVLFVYADDNDGCEMASRWATANAGRFYLSLKVFSGFASCAAQPNTWHQYAPAIAEIDMAPYAITISPGFDLYGEVAQIGSRSRSLGGERARPVRVPRSVASDLDVQRVGRRDGGRARNRVGDHVPGYDRVTWHLSEPGGAQTTSSSPSRSGTTTTARRSTSSCTSARAATRSTIPS